MRYPKTAGFGKSMGFPAEEKIDRAYFMVFLSYGNSVPYRKERFFLFLLNRFTIHIGGETKCPVILFSHKSRRSLQILLNS